MKLLTAQVTNFRSVEDSGEFKIDPTVTCLVGKNEAGKSAILTALATLNPHPATPIVLDKERDYPRRFLTKYSERHPKDEAVVIKTTWQIFPAQIKEAEALFGKEIFKSTVAEIFRRYGSATPEWSLSLDIEKGLEHLYSSHKLNAAERSPINSASNSQELIEALEKIEAPTEKQAELLNSIKAHKSVTSAILAILKPTLPRFMYFSNYDRMDGAVQIETLNERIADASIEKEQFRGQKLFKEFFEYAGVPLEEILKETRYESFDAKLQAASNNITEQILEYWTQNPDLEVRVRIEQAKPGDEAPLNTGTIARARVHNQLHKVDTPFSERSAGFIWFFSFLVKFAQVKTDDTPVVLLLDEPGLTLHGKAQGDLLRYFDEKLASHHQIIYSTHSPFMISPNRLLSARIVEDRVEIKSSRRVPIGTKVRQDVLTTDRDTLFPLQGALGYEITQTLFVGKNTLLVEGPGDIIYLKVLSSALGHLSRTTLDAKWTMCPVGGITNVKSFVALFGGQEISVAVLADLAAGQKKEVERIRELEIFKGGNRVLTIEQFTGKTESDIEDLFEPSLYVEIVNSAFGLKGAAALTEAKLAAADSSTVRLVKKTEAYMRTAAATVPNFDHYRSAEWLMLNPGILDVKRGDVMKTLARAEAVFTELNKWLN